MKSSLDSLRDNLEKIVRDYLFNVSSLSNHNYFNHPNSINSRDQYYSSKGFKAIKTNNENEYIVDAEHFLEGCTRVFLVNPIIEELFEHYGIIRDWRDGMTFDSHFEYSNRDYENDAFVEFIFVHCGKQIGCRYTRCTYNAIEASMIDRNIQYQLYRAPISRFDNLKYVDEVWAIDWSGISSGDLAKIHPPIEGLTSFTRDISIRDFLCEIFSEDAYSLFFELTSTAFREAQKIIALRAVPQLLPNNMLLFKEYAESFFSESEIALRQYVFAPTNQMVIQKQLSPADIDAINKRFFTKEYRKAIFGRAEFAKSFITSEYLFHTTSKELSIDYTAVVVGYLKSVEQLLYLIYESAFDNNNYLSYWDTFLPRKNDYFDLSKPNLYRYDPLDSTADLSKRKKQKYYRHFKPTPDRAPTIGKLVSFLYYFDGITSLSDDGKEYVLACLSDYGMYCRNHHFHKDNIWCSNYATVDRIRNNTILCLYYLLGAFRLLNTHSSDEEELMIVDDAFDRLYKTTRQQRRWILLGKTADGYHGLMCYLNNDISVAYDGSGYLSGTSMRFLKFPDIVPEEATRLQLQERLCNNNYVEQNTFFVTRETMLSSYEPFMVKRK